MLNAYKVVSVFPDENATPENIAAEIVQSLQRIEAGDFEEIVLD